MKFFITLSTLFVFIATKTLAQDPVENEQTSEIEEVDFKRLMNPAFAKEYTKNEVVTYVEFYDPNPNKMEMVKTPRGYMAFQVIPVGGAAKPNAFGGGEGGYHVLISKKEVDKIFDLKKGDKLKLVGVTQIKKYAMTSHMDVTFKASSLVVE